MLRATPALHKMATTKGGLRKILKKRLPVPKYIELAVKAGSYKSPSTRPYYMGLHDVPDMNGPMKPEEREMRIKMRRGILDYSTEVRACYMFFTSCVHQMFQVCSLTRFVYHQQLCCRCSMKY